MKGAKTKSSLSKFRISSRAKRFPETYNEVNDLIWRIRPKLNYGAEGRRARVKNYHYIYTRVNNEQCAVWAIPFGPQRHYAFTFFVILSPDWMRAWRGRAMSDEEIAQIPSIPSLTVLDEFKMQEMPSTVFRVNR